MVVELVSGAINWDMSIFVDKFPNPKEEVKAKKIISMPGGKGANIAVASARILGANSVGLIGALGDDELADRQLEVLKEEGIDITLIKRIQNVNSGQAFEVIDRKGENFIITYKAANHMITAKMINDAVFDKSLKECKLITVTDPPLQVAGIIIFRASDLHRLIVWSPAMLVRNGFHKIKEIIQKTDYLILNEPETRILAGMIDIKKACSMLSAKMDGKKVIGTMGARGCILCWQNKIATIPTPAPLDLNLEIVNTVGAGDAFAGVFSALKIEGVDDLESLFMANVAGLLKSTREETRGSPRYKEIRQCLDDKHVRKMYNKINVS